MSVTRSRKGLSAKFHLTSLKSEHILGHVVIHSYVRFGPFHEKKPKYS